VAACSFDTFVVTFRGGETAVVAVSGDGDTDLDLFVYDEIGHPIAADEGPTDDCRVCFCPRWTGPFRIVVRNLGPVSNVYAIAVR
jgi:hypothetical protein